MAQRRYYDFSYCPHEQQEQKRTRTRRRNKYSPLLHARSRDLQPGFIGFENVTEQHSPEFEFANCILFINFHDHLVFCSNVRTGLHDCILIYGHLWKGAPGPPRLNFKNPAPLRDWYNPDTYTCKVSCRSVHPCLSF